MEPEKRRMLPATHTETVAMALLPEVQPALAVALDSLGGTMPKQVEGRYYFFAAAHINRAVDAFILLRG